VCQEQEAPSGQPHARDPETAYYLARVQMSASRWSEAAATLDLLLRSKGTILMDSVASLILLAQYDLAVCYQRLGKYSQAELLYKTVRRLWGNADPELRNALK
jgi:tetratricopeptide (TPR) repeat protein